MSAADDGAQGGGRWFRLRPGFAGFVRVAAARPSQWAGAVAGLLGAVAVAVGGLVVALPPYRPQSLPLLAPWVDGMSKLAGNALFYGGLLLMVFAWLVVGAGVYAGCWRVRWLVVLAAVWALPWLLAPVGLSTDAYTYLGQGLVANRGLDPYTNGPFAIDQAPLLARNIAPSSRHIPSPYGPLFLGVLRVLSPLASNHLAWTMVLLRLVNVAGLGLAAACLPRVTRASGGNPPVAMWLGVASPLLLASGVLSAHNDALMLGLLVAALALATRRGTGAALAAVAVCSLAALVKPPAAVGVVVIAVSWARTAPRVRAGLARLAGSVLASAVTAAVVTVAVGLGTDWLNVDAVTSPAGVAPWFTPVRAITSTIWRAVDLVAAPPSYTAVLQVVELVGAVLVAVFAVLVLWREPRFGPARATGLILGAVVLASPTLWPWYIIWPAMLLATGRGGPGRTVWIALASVALFVVQPDGAPREVISWGMYTIVGLSLLGVVAVAVYSYRTLLAAPADAADSRAEYRLSA